MSSERADPSAFGLDDVALDQLDTVYQGYFRVERYRFRTRLFAGGWSAPTQREMFERGHAVAVLPYDPAADALVLIEQFRIGAYAAARSPAYGDGHSPWLIELIAGIIDEGEHPEQVARREAMEEAGCAVGDLQRITTILVSPGVTSELITLFFAAVDATGIEGIHGLAHEHEDIRVRVLPAQEVFQWMDEGRILNATALVGLQWFRIHYSRLRASRLAARTIDD